MGGKLKEIIIMIFLTILIIILLIIALYEYVPNKEGISEVEAYKRTPETVNVLQEISTSELATQNNESIIKSYSITSYDLSEYVKHDSYNRGRENPFADVGTDMSIENEISTNTIKNTIENTSTGYFNKTGQTK